MKVLGLLRRMLRLVLDPACDQRIFKLYSALFVSTLLISSVGTAFYIIDHINELTKITDPLHVITACTLAFVKGFSFVRHKQTVRDIFQRLQVIFNRSKDTSGVKFYEAAEQKATKVFKSVAYFLTFNSLVLLFSPLLNLIFQYLRGAYSPDLRVLPFKVRCLK